MRDETTKGIQIQDIPKDDIETRLIKIGVTEVVLAQLMAEAVALTITGPEDKEGYERVRRHRHNIVPLRTGVGRLADELNAEALAHQRRVNAKKTDLQGRLSAIEEISVKKEKVYTDQIAAIAVEKARVEKVRVDGLLQQLREIEWNGNELTVAQMTPVGFSEFLAQEKERFRLVVIGRQAEAAKVAKEKQDALDVAEANRKEQVRLDEIAKKQKADQDEFERQQREFETQKATLEQEKRNLEAEKERQAKAILEPIPEADAPDLLAQDGEVDEEPAENERRGPGASDADREKLEAIARGMEGVWDKFNLGLESDEAKIVFQNAETLVRQAIKALRVLK